ncbi:multicomponent Na+:H+ antiporter subunit D [Bacillus thermophilus]|uniref:Multicomponent Na+:H+ antiporter subunit D n=1 Tax=Siminovitchia thermophila TaxID=1245522 RepID=A0ABS2R5N5_9BACI|nr:Na+/H+ antiporter subunit D [Siminovitchia thermophila]MBM7714914.1 multicomponent Na+:H+ antiporter subunit D [Siminovitchia thermophila]ONK21794.1 Na+/H+ antiporter subunit D [Bacillus sp. VT-16-64]
MNNILVLPMVLPILTGILLVFFRKFIRTQRWISFGTMLLTAGISLYILHLIQTNGILSLHFGGWKPPFGIVFVADSFSMLLVLTTSIVTTICLLFSFYSIGESFEKMFFYPFVHFMVAGVNGSFLTGDLFNLFVCFEVMLLASYILISLGGSNRQLRESVKYVAINVLSSWLFLVAIAYLYGTLGTLNLAQLSQRIAEAGQTPILTVIGILFLIVFSLKSALLLYFWLPGSYSAPPTAVAALFGALLTKVGIYSMFRVFSLLFYHEPHITHTIIGIMAAMTLVGGSIGAIAYKDIRYIISYNVIIGAGFILVGLAVATPAAVEGSIFYLVHDMITKAMLFLLAGTMITLTGTSKMNEMSGLIRNYPVLGWLFFIVMLSLAGIPPLSGFIGKVLISQGAIEGESYILLALSLLSSIFVLYSLLRIFLQSFWGETIIGEEEEKPLKKGWIYPSILFAAATIGFGFGAEWLVPYVQDAASILMNPEKYIEAVLYQNQ